MIREGWYWVRLRGDRNWRPCDYCYENIRGRMMVADGSSFYDLDEVTEWGPRIAPPDESPTEAALPPLPEGWRRSVGQYDSDPSLTLIGYSSKRASIIIDTSGYIVTNLHRETPVADVAACLAHHLALAARGPGK